MAYIQRWERNLSGKEGQYVYDYWPSSNDNDCFFILAPVVWIAKRVFKFSLLKGIIIALWYLIKTVFRVIAFICMRMLYPVSGFVRKWLWSGIQENHKDTVNG